MSVVAMVQSAAIDREPITFDEMWSLYPKRVAKKDAREAWNKLTPDQQLAAVIGLCVWRRIWVDRGEMEFVPHCASWLNGERWEDEPPVDAVRTAHASHKLAEVGTPSPRGEVPAHVRDEINKLLKGKK